MGEARREVGGANDGTDVDGDETGGEANAMEMVPASCSSLLLPTSIPHW